MPPALPEDDAAMDAESPDLHSPSTPTGAEATADGRVTASATTVTWIPSEAAEGMLRIPMDLGIAHWDEAPPDQIGSDRTVVEALRDADRLRFANRVVVAARFADDGAVLDLEWRDESLIGSTTMQLGRRSATFAAVSLPTLTTEVERGPGFVSITQTAGGRTGAPMPRRVRHAPFVKVTAPLAWSTIALTVRADGTSSAELRGASPFPRHWLYDSSGELVSKSGLVDFAQWYRRAFGKHSPWGEEDSVALAVAVESALERTLSDLIMHDGPAPTISVLDADSLLMEQGDEGDTLVLLLDGVVRISHDGEALADLGPGAVLGERALLDGGRRTATVTTTTRCKVATVPVSSIDRGKLSELAEGHRREEAG